MIKLEISTHSGDIDVVEVTEYDAEDITDKRNDDTIEAILIGRYSYARIDLKNIKVIEENVEV